LTKTDFMLFYFLTDYCERYAKREKSDNAYSDESSEGEISDNESGLGDDDIAGNADP